MTRNSRGFTPAPNRAYRSSSVMVGGPRTVEIVREPYLEEVYEVSRPRTSYRSVRATSVALGEEPIYIRHKPPTAPRGSSRTSLPLGNPWHTSYSNVVNNLSHDIIEEEPLHRYRYRHTYRAPVIGSTYRPSFWYIGTAGFPQESAERTRRIQSRMDGLLSYEIPPANDLYSSLRTSLHSITDKLREHKQLVDRYAGVEMAPLQSAEEGINRRYQDLVDRMPELESKSYRARARATSEEPSYHTSTSAPAGASSSVNSNASAVRGRIKKLLGKTRNNY